MSSASDSAPLLDAPAGAESSADVTGARTLSSARDAFVEAVRRDTPGTELPRYVAVLDALLAWSAARSAQVTFRADAGAKNGIRPLNRPPRKGSARPGRSNPPSS